MCQVKLHKNTLFDEVRLLMECPECHDSIVMDQKLFEKDSKTIFCYFCNNKFYVVEKIDKKNYYKLELIKDTKQS